MFESERRYEQSRPAARADIVAPEFLIPPLNHLEQDPSSLETELDRKEQLLAEAVATMARLEQAIARIQGYLRELRRTYGETGDASVGRTIEQRTQQLEELETNLREATTKERALSRRVAELKGIFEDETPATEPLPPDFINACTSFFHDLVHPSRTNLLLRQDWLEDPHRRREILEHLTHHVPSFAAIQEELIHAYEERYPQWPPSECARYARRVLPLYLETLATDMTALLQAIKEQDPDADTTIAYEHAAEFLLRRFARLDLHGTDGRLLWKTARELHRTDEPLLRLLRQHQRAGGSVQTREQLFQCLEERLNEAISQGEVSWQEAHDILRHYQKYVPDQHLN